MHMKTALGVILAILPALASSAAGAQTADKYDSLFPQYVEMCSASQYRETANHSADGGPYGHSVLFLKGACRVAHAEYPQLRACDNGNGVGISTYFAFKNALWVATEGKSFFFDGGVKSNEPINERTIERAIAKAKSLGTLTGVEMQNWIMDGRPKEEEVEHYRYRMSLGTDWALTYGRNVYCVRIPVSKTAMSTVVQYLNNQNKYYRNPETPYVWDLMTNNCTDTAHNAIAAIGAWAAKATGLSKLKTFSRFGKDIAIPLNTLVADTKAAFMEPPSYRALRFSTESMNTLVRQDWLLPQAGTLFVTYPIHTVNNTYFDTNSPLKAFEVRGSVNGAAAEVTPLTNAYQLEEFKQNANYTDLQSNLKWNLERFSSQLSSLRPLTSQDPNEIAIFNAYKRYLSDQVNKAESGLRSLN